MCRRSRDRVGESGKSLEIKDLKRRRWFDIRSQEQAVMKKGIHPEEGLVLYRCASCNTKWLNSSTKLDSKVEEFEGKEYPTVVLETCSSCHPFFTEKQTFIDTTGRVEKFQKRFAKFMPAKEEK